MDDELKDHPIEPRISTSRLKVFSQYLIRIFLNQKIRWIFILLVIAGLLIQYININLISRKEAQAAGKTWTSTSDFATWTQASTQATNNTLILASSGGSSGATLKSATFPSPGVGASAVWDSTHNVAYIFSGNNNDTNTEIYRYNPATDTLVDLNLALPFWQDYGTAVWDSTGQKAYLFGGQFSGVNGNKILVFDPNANSGAGSINTLALTMPKEVEGMGAVWNPAVQKAYLFGGYGSTVTSKEIYVFDPNANSGAGSITTLALTMPVTVQFSPAVWDPGNAVAYIFGSSGGNGNEIFVFNPSANGGAGSITTHNKTLPFYNNYMPAVWDGNQNKAYTLGGNNNKIVIFDPNANGGAGNVSTDSAVLPSAHSGMPAAWDAVNGKVYTFQGYDPNNPSDDIIEYTPASSAYASSGTATIVYTPLAGGTNVWQSASANTTLNGQTLTTQYTTDPNCTTGLTSTISSLANSESICIKVSLITTDTSLSPVLADLTISYATYGQTETQTWTTTPDFDTWTKTKTEALNDSLSLTYTDDVGQASLNKSAVLPRRFSGSSVIFDPLNNKFYVFGGADYSTTATARDAYNTIIEYDPSTGAVTKKSATLPTGLEGTSAVWDSTNNVAYIFGGDHYFWNHTDQFNTFYSSNLQNSILKYNPATDTLTTLTPTLPSARQYTSAVWDTTNHVAYIFGGDDAISTPTNQIIQFDPAGSGTVTTKSEVLPYLIQQTTAVWNPSTNKAYIFGGNKSVGGFSDEVIEYTPGTGTLRKASDGLPTLPSARTWVAAAWNSANSKAYIFGGNISGGATDQIIEFNPAANSGNGSFITKSAVLPDGRWGSAAAYDASDGLVYNFGGTKSSIDPSFDQIIPYNPSTDTVGPLSFLPRAINGPSAVYAPSQGKVYSFGGGSDTNPIYEYDPSTNRAVTKTAAFGGALQETSAVWNPTNNVAYIFGGLPVSNKIYKYTPSSDTLTQLTPTLPTARAATAAVWDPNNQVAYIFGGYGSTTGYNTILKFDPNANGGTGSVTTLSATLPTANYKFSAVWNPNTNTAYLFGGDKAVIGGNTVSPGTGTDVVEFNPATNSGNGSTTLKLTGGGIPTCGGAVWSTNRNKAYMLGGPCGSTDANNSVREYNPTTNTLRFPTNSGGNAYLRFMVRDSAAVWDSDTNKAYVLGGFGSGILNNSPNYDGNAIYYMDSIAEYTPGRRVYDTPGPATIIFTPSTGTTYHWVSATSHATLNGQTVSLQYTTNTDCLTGLTTDITTLADSESLCAKATLSTADDSLTPTLDDIAISYLLSTSIASSPSPSGSTISSLSVTQTATPTSSANTSSLSTTTEPPATATSPSSEPVAVGGGDLGTPQPSQATPTPLTTSVTSSTVQAANLGTGNSILLAWIRPTDPSCTSVNIYRSTVRRKQGIIVATGVTGEEQTIGGLKTGRSYYFSIRAVCASIESRPTDQVRVIPTKRKDLPKTGPLSLTETVVVKSQQFVRKPKFQPSDYTLEIDAINVSAPIVLNVSGTDLADYLTALQYGVAQYAGSSLPGESGNMVIFGHSSSNRLAKNQYKSIFKKLNDLVVGDTIVITHNKEKIRYIVTKKSIIKPNDFSVLAPTNTTDQLTLITCWPVGTSSKRLVVVANRL